MNSIESQPVGSVISVRRRVLTAVVALGSFGLFPSIAPAQDAEGEDEPRALTEEERIVRDNLKDYLQPTSLKFNDDGSVEMLFDFEKKDPAHAKIFTPPGS